MVAGTPAGYWCSQGFFMDSFCTDGGFSGGPGAAMLRFFDTGNRGHDGAATTLGIAVASLARTPRGGPDGDERTAMPSESVILYVLNSGNLYGTERMALATLAGMEEYVHRVVAAPRPNETESVANAARAVGFETVTFQTRWEFIKAVLPWFRPFRRVDMIGTGVAQSFLAHVLARVLFVRLRQLQVSHGGTEDWHAYGKKKSLNRLPVRIIAVSEFVRGKLIEHGVRPHAISVIDNFLTDAGARGSTHRPPYDAALAGARPVDRERVRVAVVSRIDPIKRIDLLITAVESRGLHHFMFDIYGSGSEIASLRRRAERLPNVRFHGYVAGAPERVAEADLLLHLCPDEPFGLVVLEAYAAGVVALVPDRGGAGSIVDNGATGLHFNAGDVGSLVTALENARALPGPALQKLADAVVTTR
jgi:glycosyltransferase involved in cell wall biosynthesis